MTTKPVKATRKTIVKKECLKCKVERTLDKFYSTTDTDYYEDSKLPVCKICCQANIEKNGFEGFKTLMRMINKPIYDDMFKGDYFEYIKNVNSLPQFRSTTFESSDLFKENKTLEVTKRAKPKELSPEDLRESEDFWGIGKSERDYIWLNNEFGGYLSKYEVDSKTLEDLITEICLTRLDIRTRRENNQDVDKQIKTLNELLTAANLKPVQETGAQSVDQESFGTLIKKWEDTRPIQDDSEWKKHDSIGNYLKVWFTGHLMRMFNIENKDEKEYFDEINKYTVATNDTEEENEGEQNGRS